MSFINSSLNSKSANDVGQHPQRGKKERAEIHDLAQNNKTQKYRKRKNTIMLKNADCAFTSVVLLCSHCKKRAILHILCRPGQPCMCQKLPHTTIFFFGIKFMFSKYALFSISFYSLFIIIFLFWDLMNMSVKISHPSGFLDILIFQWLCLFNVHYHFVSCCLCSLMHLFRYLAIKKSITGHVIYKPLSVLLRSSHYSILQISVLSLHITLTG